MRFCLVCHKSFKTADDLRQHILIHVPQFKATFDPDDQKKTKSRSDLVYHLQRHSYNRKYFCNICFREFKKSDYLKHKSIHEPKIFQCPVCKALFSHEKRLKNHTQIHWNELYFNYDIKIEEALKSFASLTKIFEALELANSQNESEEEIREYRCHICSQTLPKKKDLILHLTDHHEKKYQCDFCKCLFESKEHLVDHIATHDNDKYTCKTCGVDFTSHNSLNSHVRVHQNLLMHACKFCAQMFRSQTSLRNHLKIHSKRQVLSCELCTKTFLNKNCYKNHQELHNRGKIYICHYCKKLFTGESSLKRHVKLHTLGKLVRKPVKKGRTKMTCKVCGNSFVGTYNLKKHMEIHPIKNRIKVEQKTVPAQKKFRIIALKGSKIIRINSVTNYKIENQHSDL